MNAPDANTRRGFFGWIAAGVAAAPFVGGLFVALRAAGTPARTQRPQRLPLCNEADVPATGLLARPVSYEMRRGPRVESTAQVVFVTRDAGGGIVALSSRCTHLGCQVVHAPDDAAAPLHCPCHDARFAADGAVLDGPPARPLDRLTTERGDDGTIYLVLG